ncbi:hypothetical protein ACET3Z_030239 [Daucus carota]
MGKKVKKKARAGNKEKRVAKSVTASEKAAPANDTSVLETEAVDAVVPAVEDRRICPHFDKGFNLVKVSLKLGSPGPLKCEDCREESYDRRASKAKGKGKKKGSGSVDSNSGEKAIWMCLECGHFSCGGLGFPTTPQSHAVRHARQNRHHLAIQFKNTQLRWCFPCSTLIPVGNLEENGHTKDVLFDIVKLMKVRPTEGASIDVEDVWFGSGSVLSDIKTENATLNNIYAGGGYKVRGLTNLGNTCFFNSVLQNLLAMQKLRDHFLQMEESIGPLTVSLKKLFVEIYSGSGVKNVITPKALLGCVCAKAPQFRGFQQHDSHELLRCLLDGLCTEELSARKQAKSLKEDGTSPNVAPTFVDAVFGGMLCSTVTCLKCSHSSIVHEPFLDLSLPIPSKRPPFKKAKPVTQPKKTKLPPKRSQRIRSKVNRNADPVHRSSTPSVEDITPSAVVSTSEFTGQVVSGNESNLVLENNSATQESNNLLHENVVEKTVPADDDTSWLDYLEPDTVSSDYELAAQDQNMDAGDEDASENIVSLQNVGSSMVMESSNQDSLPCTEQTEPLEDSFTSMDYLNTDGVSNDPTVYSHSNDISSVPDSVIKDATMNGEIPKHDSEFSNLILPEDSSRKMDWGENSWEDEPLLQVQSSEVLLLPYKEDTSTADGASNSIAGISPSPVADEQDSMDFGGFGDLFNEPEVVEGPVMGPMNRNEVVGTGTTFGNSSGSDLDEIDNTDAPISVERCVSFFTKPELLLKDEHAWHCENCSKIVLEQRKLKKADKLRSNVLLNGDAARVQDPLLCSGQFEPLPIGSKNHCNGNNKREVLDPLSEKLTSSNGSIDGELNDTTESNQKSDEHLPVDPLLEEEKYKISVALQKLTINGENSNDSFNINESVGAGCYPVSGQQSKLDSPPGERESGSEDVEVDSESIKVKRDATKRILIDRAPPILTIHLKRFSQDARGRISKLQGHVDFSDMVDLGPYMHPRSAEKRSCIYRLLGVVEHLGTIRGGHYVAYIRGGLKSMEIEKANSDDYTWYHASDTYIRQVSFEEVLRCEAYILFYEEI